MNRRAFLSSLAASLPLAAIVTLAHPAEARPPGPPGPPPDVRLEQRLEQLGLDPGQMEKVRAILDASKPKRQEIHSQLRAGLDQLHSLLEQESPDEAAIMSQADMIGALRTERQKQMLHTLLQVRALLTPEQRKQLMEMNRREGPPPWRHRRGTFDD